MNEQQLINKHRRRTYGELTGLNEQQRLVSTKLPTQKILS